jgi:TRAP-type C4-dicarboxylate transport system permease small subunit
MRRTSTGLYLPMTYPYAAIPIGAALIALFLLARRVTR